MICFLSLFLLLVAIHGTPVPTILDTDIGTAYDDHLALVYILSCPNRFDLKLIVCSTTNTTARAQIVAKTLSFFKRFDIPIGVGRTSQDTYGIFQYRWAKDYSLEQFQSDGGTVFFNGEQALADEMKKASTNQLYYYIHIGPATSLANVLEKYQSLSMNIRLFAMAGSLYYGYENSATPSKEYNIEHDIRSAQTMFASNWTYFSLAPLDCTNFMQFNGLLWKKFLSYRNRSRTVNMIIESYTIWYNDGGSNMSAIQPFNPELGTPEMHDILAVYLASSYTSVAPTISNFLPIVVTNDGYTFENQTIKKTINTCLKYQTLNPYDATAQIGWKVFESIIQSDVDMKAQGHHFSICRLSWIILSICMSLYICHYQ
ncbi:unnamed protein product [Rotaria sordida]|uniref:Inosine/uridine-preferring nucleoside hydrolase domain-containing protein n=1 Tax=Rotaria sordida TaxID=392033 RepID=A0A813QA34_9BILA|nr:unnamed protein product [Rotaria sordida]